MALSEFEIKRYEMAKRKFLIKRRPYLNLRNKYDLNCLLKDQSVEIYELRPQWNNPKNKIKYTLAKATYTYPQKEWRIFWMNRNLKWHSYSPNETAKTIEDVFAIIDHDENGIFFG